MRVLLLGNTANNSFYAAKLLNRAGIEADVLCHGTYHLMSCPEWEDADFDQIPKDHYQPDWWSIDLHGYERPRWFAQAPLEAAVPYLLARRRGQHPEAEQLWRALEDARRSLVHPPPAEPPKPSSERPAAPSRRPLPRRILKKAQRVAGNLRERVVGAPPRPPTEIEQLTADVSLRFRERFPGRADVPTVDDLRPYEEHIRLLAPLFREYDVVHGSGTDPVLPMLARFHPYVGFEHGTLRDSPDVPFDYKGPSYPNAIGRLTSLAYSLADYVFITNADCVSAVEPLQIRHFAGIPHPFDDAAFRAPADEVLALRRAEGVDHLFFCPIRHDWEEKGTDRYLRALPELRRRIPGRFRAVFTRWGTQVARSEALIAELGIGDLVQWIEPVGRVRLARWLCAADAIWDQLVYTSLSGLGPRTLAAGTPVIGAYEHEGLRWMFPEPAPIIAARTVENVVERTLEAIAPGFRDDFQRRAHAWVAAYHSADVMVRALLRGYEHAIAAHAGREFRRRTG